MAFVDVLADNIYMKECLSNNASIPLAIVSAVLLDTVEVSYLPYLAQVPGEGEFSSDRVFEFDGGLQHIVARPQSFCFILGCCFSSL